MTIGQIQSMSKEDIRKHYKELPEPYYPTHINSDADPLHTILESFNSRAISDSENEALQKSLLKTAKLGMQTRQQ